MKIILSIDLTEIKVSDCDWLFLAGYNWHKCKRSGYFLCSNGGKWNNNKVHAKSIHWFVSQLMDLKIQKGLTIDHINRDKADNTRGNLRIATKRAQACNRKTFKTNTSGLEGVHFQKDKYRPRPYMSQIYLNGKSRFLGMFATAKEANGAYIEAKTIRDKIILSKETTPFL